MSSSSEPVVVSKTTLDSSDAVHAKVPMLSVLLMALVVAVVVLAVSGAAGFYMLRSGKLPIKDASCSPKAEARKPGLTHAVALEPLVVNLADPGGRAYLRVVVTLLAESMTEPVAANAKAKGEKVSAGGEDDTAAIRDTMLTVLGNDTSDVLLAADGKERLKARLLLALAERVPATKVKQIYFTEFLVQR